MDRKNRPKLSFLKIFLGAVVLIVLYSMFSPNFYSATPDKLSLIATKLDQIVKLGGIPDDLKPKLREIYKDKDVTEQEYRDILPILDDIITRMSIQKIGEYTK